ncbi:MAG: hypothetical protein OJF49_000675 [Ktedonobacterales bacterium]|nr:MAG: hypothetical protein OJF49_000675 [Ktedonobacterales bacterium]
MPPYRQIPLWSSVIASAPSAHPSVSTTVLTCPSLTPFSALATAQLPCYTIQIAIPITRIRAMPTTHVSGHIGHWWPTK